MRGTRLWQAAGSPIIQGRSRTEKPFWQDWVAAMAVSAGAVIAVGAVAAWPLEPLNERVLTLLGTAIVSLPIAAAPAAFAVWISRRTRLGKAWLIGSIAGAVCAIVFLTPWSGA